MLTGKTLRVLIVDDSIGDVLLLQTYLQSLPAASVEIKHNATASEAFATAESQDFDCVFLDYQLEESTGLDFLKELRNANNDLPVIFLTGCGSEKIAVEALSLGAQDYLVKGTITAESLQHAIHHATTQVELSRLLKEKQAELERFTGMAAHDLLAPARRMFQLTEILLEELTDVSDEHQQLLEIVATNSHRMYDLVTRLTEYTRIGRSQVQTSPIDLNEILAEVRENLALAISQTGATIKADALPTITGDRIALIQLLQNLISNGMKFCQHPPCIEIKSERQDASWHITVGDNGIGIDEKYLEYIFAPFKRLETQDKYEGSGLGLSICRTIMDQHGGKIWVESQSGEGATFHLLFPEAKTAPDAEQHAAPNMKPHSEAIRRV